MTKTGLALFAVSCVSLFAIGLHWINSGPLNSRAKTSVPDRTALLPILDLPVQQADPARETGIAVEGVGGGVANPKTFQLAGDVVFIDGRPAPNLQLQSPLAIEPFWSDEEGHFEVDAFATHAMHSVLLHEAKDHAVVRSGLFDTRAPSQRPRLVIASRTNMHVTIVDAEGVPVEGLEVGLDYSEVCSLLDPKGSLLAHYGAETDERGDAYFDSIPAVEGVLVWVLWNETYTSTPVSLVDFSNVRIQLEPKEEDKLLRLSGIVFSEVSGALVPDAHVNIGHVFTKTDGLGHFVLETFSSQVGEEESLCVWKESIGAAFIKSSELEPDGVPMRLGLTPLRTIKGQAVWSDGTPYANARIGLHGGVLMRDDMHPPPLIESKFSGPEWWTDVNGRFELLVLPDRNYSFSLLDKSTSLSCSPALEWDGDRVRLIVDLSMKHRRVDFVAVDRVGKPIVGVDVVARVLQTQGGGLAEYAMGAAAVTDARGRAVLEGVAPVGAVLSFTSGRIIPSTVPIEGVLESGRVVLPLAQEVRVTWDTNSGMRPSYLAFLDQNGHKTIAGTRVRGQTSFGFQVRFPRTVEGLFLEVGDNVVEVVALRGGHTIARVPIFPQGSGVTEVALR